MPCRRITLWGNSGSGKSTLAEQAGRKLGMPVLHLDLLAWETSWQFRPEPEFLTLQRPWLERPEWIIEGVGHWSGLVERFEHADMIVHVDTPAAICRERANRRITEDQIAKNRFMADGCRYGDVVERQAEVIGHFEEKLSHQIRAILVGEFALKRQCRLDGTLPPNELCNQLFAQTSG